MDNNSKEFINYLDEFKNKHEVSYNDYLILLKKIDENYKIYFNHIQLLIPMYIKNEDIKNNYVTTFVEPICMDNYNIEEQNNLFFIPPYSFFHPNDIEVKKKIQKEKIFIDVKIINIDSILQIIDTYEYNPEIEYNIDLKLLHNIRSELIEINNMVGINTFKESIISQLLYFIQELHINKEHDFKHMVIYGAPGTGKTQIAKLIGTMFSKLGILKKNIFRKVTRTDLIAGYLGQTAIKTNKVIEECLGGCLFIDEVYSLGTSDLGNNSFSKECIDTLCEALSNYKEDLMVIVAGYKEDVNEYFFKANQGLDSRFIWRFELEGYSPKELMQIFILKVEQNGWKISIEQLENWFIINKEYFKNYGRDMELLFSYTKISHGRRIYGKDINLRKKITIDDLENGLKVFKKHNSKNTEPEIPFGLYI